jgi:hypothetical protein
MVLTRCSAVLLIALAASSAPGQCPNDADGDGYGDPGCTSTCDDCEGIQTDCDDSDAAIHAGANEICGDGKDNDCDDYVDETECKPAPLRVTCELESVCRNCVGWYRINFDVLNAMGEPLVVAELLAIDHTGQVIGSVPVEDGDAAKLAALKKTREEDCQRIESLGGVHHVFAPVPLLRVEVRDDVGEAVAFCSNTPYVQVIEPEGSLICGNEVHVVVAIPNVDPRTLKVFIGGVDIIPLLVPDPATQLPGGPFSGIVNVGGTMIDVQNLIVETAVGEQSSNTVSMTLLGAGCVDGGYLLRVEGTPNTAGQETPFPSYCHLDDLIDPAN